MNRHMYIYIDIENISERELRFADRLPRNTNVFIPITGTTKFSYESVKAMMKTNADINFYPIGTTGKNALDFYLSAAIAADVSNDPSGNHFIISRDNDFRHIQSFCNEYFHEHVSIVQYPTFKEFLIETNIDNHQPIQISDYEFLAK